MVNKSHEMKIKYFLSTIRNPTVLILCTYTVELIPSSQANIILRLIFINKIYIYIYILFVELCTTASSQVRFAFSVTQKYPRRSSSPGSGKPKVLTLYPIVHDIHQTRWAISISDKTYTVQCDEAVNRD